MPSGLASSPFVGHLVTLAGHTAPVSGMAWSPDGRWLASCSVDGEVKIWSPPKVTRPRFTLRGRATPRAFTGVAWSADSEYLACSSEAGMVDVWQAGTFNSVEHGNDPERSPVRCLAWAPAIGDDRRLAFGGDGRKVHFRNYRHWDVPDNETGIGHESAILSVAWSTDGATVITGTSDGVIGVWETSSIDNQLRAVLSTVGYRAHSGAVNTVAWSSESGVLVSGGADGAVRVWDVGRQSLIDEAMWDEDVLDVDVSPGGGIVIVQTRDHLRFIRLRPFREIAAYDMAAVLEPVTSTLSVDINSRLAILNPEDASVIAIWNVDFASLLKASELTKRSFSAIGVSLLGTSGSGRTRLGHALSGQHFVESSPLHPFNVYRLPLPTVTLDNGVEQVRELAVWNLPSRENHATMHRMHAGDGAVALMVLPPIPGSVLTDRENTDRWQPSIRHWRSASRSRKATLLPVVTKCDVLSPVPRSEDAADVARVLGVDRVFLTSTKTDTGIAELRAAIEGSVDWRNAPTFPSVEGFGHIRQFISTMRAERRYLTSVSEIYAALGRELRFLDPLARGLEDLKDAMRLLEIIGEVQFFDDCDEVLLDTSLYHTYAAAMIAAAANDPKGMGRLPEQEARRGYGSQMVLPSTDAQLDAKERTRILGLTIGELMGRGAAQLVSTDGRSHVVFPMTLARVQHSTEPAAAIHAQFVGPARDMFSSLLVRFLGLVDEYPEHDLSTTEASFKTLAGGRCGIRIKISDGGDEAELSIYFSEDTNEGDQRAFASKVRRHLEECGEVSGDLIDGWAPKRAAAAVAPAAAYPPVFLSWACDPRDAQTAAGVDRIAEELRKRGIDVRGDLAVALGDAVQDRAALADEADVAVALLAERPTKTQEVEWDRLTRAGCRIIFVILPHAKKNSLPPRLPVQFACLDFRGKFTDLEGLAEGVRAAQRAGRRIVADRGWVFLSYQRIDSERITPLITDLEGANHRVWWDGLLPPGQDWPRDLTRAIHDSYAFLACFSAASVARSRSYAYPEIDEAIKIQRTLRHDNPFIVPVRLTECEIPATPIDANRTLQSLQRFDYFGRNQRLPELVRVLDAARHERDVGLSSEPPGAATR